MWYKHLVVVAINEQMKLSWQRNTKADPIALVNHGLSQPWRMNERWVSDSDMRELEDWWHSTPTFLLNMYCFRFSPWSTPLPSSSDSVLICSETSRSYPASYKIRLRPTRRDATETGTRKRRRLRRKAQQKPSRACCSWSRSHYIRSSGWINSIQFYYQTNYAME